MTRDKHKIGFFVIFFAFILSFISILSLDHESGGNEVFNSGFLNPSDPVDNPVLENPAIDVDIGYANNTNFNFTVMYRDAANVSPSYVNLTILHQNWTANYSMEKSNASDNNYDTGVEYYCNTTLPFVGNYSHYFVANNTVNETRLPETGQLNGPSVVKLRNYTSIPFQWYNSSNATYPPDPFNELMYVFNLNFNFTIYDQNYTSVQISHFGFSRFVQNGNRLPIEIPSSSSRAQLAFLTITDSNFDITPSGLSNLKVLNENTYLLYEQNLTIANGTGIQNYSAKYQVIIHENASIQLNINYINYNFTMSDTIGWNYGNGYSHIPFYFDSNVTNVSLMFEFPSENNTNISCYNVTPATGNQVTNYTFSLNYQNLENIGPYTTVLTLDGVNYTMSPSNASDTNYIDGTMYETTLQYLDYGVPHEYSYHVHGPDGWFHSGNISGPTVSEVNNFSPVIESFSMDPLNGYVNIANVTIEFSYKDNDNQAPVNISVIFNASGTFHTYPAVKVDINDTFYIDGCLYRLYITGLNASFLYENFTFYIHADDGGFTSRLPTNVSDWLNGPNWITPVNYTSSQLLDFEWKYTFTDYEFIYSLTNVSLPFTFPFYGKNYTSVLISPEGFVRFSDNLNTTLPEPSNTTDYAQSTINLLGVNFWFGGTTDILYEFINDNNTLVICYDNILYYNGTDVVYLGDFQLILHSNGDIIFSFLNVQHIIPGGVNLGDGNHYTFLPVNNSAAPMSFTSFIFTQPKSNSPNYNLLTNETVYPTYDDIIFKVDYNSPNSVALKEAFVVIDRMDFQYQILPTLNETMIINYSTFVNYSYVSGLELFHNASTTPGYYNFTFYLVDVFNNQFQLQLLNVVVNDPPEVTVNFNHENFAPVGGLMVFSFLYWDNEGFAPDFFNLTWNGVDYALQPQSSNYSNSVEYRLEITLSRGNFTYYAVIKDQHRPDLMNVSDSAGSVEVLYPLVIEVIDPIPSTIYIPGTYTIRVRISSQEGFDPYFRRIEVNGEEINLVKDTDYGLSSDVYYADITFEAGTYNLRIVANDGYNVVVLDNMELVTVIDMPLILIIVASIAGGISLVLIIRARATKAKRLEKERVKKKILMARQKKREKREAKLKREQEKKEELKKLEAYEATLQEPVTVKKSSSYKKVSKSSSSGPARTSTSSPTARTSGKTGTQSRSARDKSKFAPKATDVGTLLNKTVMKEYLERMKREGTTTIHYLKFKNDLNVISKNKSRKLYRLLQELVEANILVRKGSKYTIVR